MPIDLTSLDLHFLLKELQLLKGARFDKVYLQENHFAFGVYLPSKGKQFLHIVLPGMLFLSEDKLVEPEESGFIGILRKYLSNTIILSVEQYAFERILIIETKHNKLVIELFDKGNILLLKPDNTIVSAHLFKKFRARAIRGGIPYAFPENRLDPSKLTLSQLELCIKDNNQEIVKTLARNLSLGGKYAEEVLERSQIDKTKKQITLGEQERLLRELNTLLQQDPQASLYADTFSPIALQTKPPTKTFSSFNELLAHLYIPQNALPKINPQIAKIQNILEKQKQLLSTLEKEHEENAFKGNKIYEQYAFLEKLLEAIKHDKQKLGWQEVKKKLATHNISIDENKGLLQVELP